MTDVDWIAALWCSHCNALETIDSCRACKCSGDERAVFVLPHVICYGCASKVPKELLGDLLRAEAKAR